MRSARRLFSLSTTLSASAITAWPAVECEMSGHWRVVVDTSDVKGLLYEVTEVGGTYYVDDYGGIFVTRQGTIARTESLDEAIEAINEHVQQEQGCNPTDIEVEDWD